MAQERGRVPAYAESLDRVRGAGSLPGLIGEIEERADEMRSHGRGMFERWLDSTLG